MKYVIKKGRMYVAHPMHSGRKRANGAGTPIGGAAGRSRLALLNFRSTHRKGPPPMITFRTAWDNSTPHLLSVANRFQVEIACCNADHVTIRNNTPGQYGVFIAAVRGDGYYFHPYFKYLRRDFRRS